MLRQNILSILVLLCLTASGCSNITMIKTSTSKLLTHPNYEESVPFWLWGMIGEHHVYIDRACNGQMASQIVTQRSPMDSILTIVTLGIYSPRTVKIWCN